MNTLTASLLQAMFLLSFAIRSEARLGESPEECQQRYGAARLDPQQPDARFYETGGFRIVVRYIAGRAALIEFAKINRQPLAESEIADLLNADTGDSRWIGGEKDRLGLRQWKRSDGEASALADGATLFIQSRIWDTRPRGAVPSRF